MQAVELIDEPLELGHGVVALVGGDLLIDGESHGFDGGAHLADGVKTMALAIDQQVTADQRHRAVTKLQRLIDQLHDLQVE